MNLASMKACVQYIARNERKDGNEAHGFILFVILAYNA